MSSSKNPLQFTIFFNFFLKYFVINTRAGMKFTIVNYKLCTKRVRQILTINLRCIDDILLVITLHVEEMVNIRR